MTGLLPPARDARPLFLALLSLCLCLPACADERRVLESGGVKREYLLHVPKGLSVKAPLVLMFHGGGGFAKRMARFSGFNELADRGRFLVAYPQGLYRQWNDGREAGASRTHEAGTDDVGFVARVLDDVARRHDVDPARVYATGISNGGIFCHWLAAHMADRICAIAPVAGGVAPALARDFRPARPVSVLVIQATDDPLVPYGGGAVAKERGSIVPTEEALRLWIGRGKCWATGYSEDLPDRDPKDGCTVRRTTWSRCDDLTEVVLLRETGAGHTWPSGPQYLPKRLVGRVCRDISSADIWEFFMLHPRP